MTETPTHTPLPCPCCRSAEIENERPDSPVYCRKCWLRAVDLERWNTREDSHHRLVEALEAERTWHEDHDKAISKQPNANTGDNGWRRMEHQERIAEITAALKEARHG